MVLLHVPALVASGGALLQDPGNPERLSGFLALSAAMLFFLLKLWGVGLLRFKTDRSSLVAIGVVLVLIHADVIGGHLNLVAAPRELPLAATAFLAAELTRVPRAVGAALSGSCRTTRRANRALSAGLTASFRALAPHLWNPAACLCTPRAPPA